MAETEIIVKPDIPTVPEGSELTANAVPAFMAQHVEDFLRMSGIEAETWSWHHVVRGLAPIDVRQAFEGLRDFDEAGIFAIAPYVIESPLTHEQMTLLCRQMFASVWYAKRKIWGDDDEAPNEFELELFAEMTAPGRTMSDAEREMALDWRKRYLAKVGD